MYICKILFNYNKSNQSNESKSVISVILNIRVIKLEISSLQKENPMITARILRLYGLYGISEKLGMRLSGN